MGVIDDTHCGVATSLQIAFRAKKAREVALVLKQQAVPIAFTNQLGDSLGLYSSTVESQTTTDGINLYSTTVGKNITTVHYAAPNNTSLRVGYLKGDRWVGLRQNR